MRYSICFTNDREFAHIPAATRAFSNRLAELRIPHRFDDFAGDHENRAAARLESTVLPYIGNARDRPE